MFRRLQSSPRRFSGAAALALSGLFLGLAFAQTVRTPSARTPASLWLGEFDDAELRKPPQVFEKVFGRLPDEVTVYPTENYLYFRFGSRGKEVWGNLRLAAYDRDSGKLHIGYYEYRDDLRGPEDAHFEHAVLDGEEGVSVFKAAHLTYDVTYKGRTVRFRLNPLSQTIDSERLHEDEEALFRLQDESNVIFTLVYNHTSNSFYYLADTATLGELTDVGGGLFVEQPSRFAFWVDPDDSRRKILIGVHNDNVRLNTYHDGPFDQLADNFMDDRFRARLERAYPQVAGRVDRYGFFRDQPDARFAVLAYHNYYEYSDLLSVIEYCSARASGGAPSPACLTQDHQYAAMAAPPAGCAAPVTVEQSSSPKLNAANGEPPPCTPHDTGYTYVHRPGVTWIDPGTRHDSGITYVHRPTATWIPPRTPHDTDITYLHRRAVSWVPPGARHTAGSTHVHNPVASFPPAGTPHDTGGTYTHRPAISWIPPGSRHNAGSTYTHTATASFPPGGTPHTTGTTYAHVAGNTWIPPGTRHTTGTTYTHLNAVTWIPPNTPHNVGQTYTHNPAASWVPPGTRHTAGTTYAHTVNISFPPAGTLHTIGVTYQHVGALTWIPPNALHTAGQTYAHRAGATWPPRGTPHTPGASYLHGTGVTWPPSGTRHSAGQTYTHFPAASWVPPNTPHSTGTTYTHFAGVTFITPGARHTAGSTYVHVAGGTWVPGTTPHDPGFTYLHRTGASFVPGNTPHDSGQTYVHRVGVTFVAPFTPHDSGQTYVHRPGVSFVTPNARHNAGTTYVHTAGATWP